MKEKTGHLQQNAGVGSKRFFCIKSCLLASFSHLHLLFLLYSLLQSTLLRRPFSTLHLSFSKSPNKLRTENITNPPFLLLFSFSSSLHTKSPTHTLSLHLFALSVLYDNKSSRNNAVLKAVDVRLGSRLGSLGLSPQRSHSGSPCS